MTIETEHSRYQRVRGRHCELDSRGTRNNNIVHAVSEGARVPIVPVLISLAAAFHIGVAACIALSFGDIRARRFLVSQIVDCGQGEGVWGCIDSRSARDSPIAAA